jgi:predicted DsbA family dithiol-disulfide isomerase
VQVEVWADLICPWCGLGLHRLDLAVERFEHGDDVTVVHRSFQLDPSAPVGVTIPARKLLEGKGMSPDQALAAMRRVEDLAAADGLSPYHVADNQVGSTALAHELLAHATARGLGPVAWPALLTAYFGDQRDIFTEGGLVELAVELGLDGTEVAEVLGDRRHRDQVADDQLAATHLGAQGVPFFVVDGRYAVSGAQPVEVLLDVLETAWADRAAPDSA